MPNCKRRCALRFASTSPSTTPITQAPRLSCAHARSSISSLAASAVTARRAGFRKFAGSVPHRCRTLPANFLNPARLAVTADAAKLDIDDLACAQLNRGACVMGVVDGLVEANRSAHLRLQFGMIENVVPGERLLDHHELVSVECLQMGGLLKMISRIRVNHEPQSRKALANCGDKLQILARLDFDLDALITRGQFFFNGGNQGLRIALNAH